MSTTRYWRAWWGTLSLTERAVAVIVTLLAILAVVLVFCSEPFEVHAESVTSTIGQEIASNNALIALIITMPTVIGVIAPIVVTTLNNRNLTRIRAEERADRVETARLLKANNAVVANTAAQTQGQLHQIHTLVNSNLTLANKLALEATKAALVATKAQRNLMPDSDARADVDARIRALEFEISEMELALSERIAAAARADIAPERS